MRKWRVTHFFLLIMAIMAGYLLTDYLRSRRAGLALLEINPEGTQFGEAWAYEELDWSVSLRNPSRRTVKVFDLRASCGCASISPRRFSLNPGEEQTVGLVLRFPHPRNDDSKCRQPFNFTLTAIHEPNSAPPQRWSISGTVRRPLEFKPPQIDFMEDLTVGSLAQPRRIAVSCLEPVTALEAVSESDAFRVDVHQVHGKPAEFLLDVTPLGTLPLGAFRTEVVIRPQLERGGLRPAIRVPVFGVVVPDVEATPAELLLGPLAVGKPEHRVVRIQSRSGRPITNICIESAGPGVSAVVERGNSGAFQINVDILPAQPGHVASEIELKIIQEQRAEVALMVPVSWYGFTPGGHGDGAAKSSLRRDLP